MKIVTFKGTDGQVRGGVLEGDRVYPLPETGGDDTLAAIRNGVIHVIHAARDGQSIPLEGLSLLAPLLHPPRIFGTGLNYREHAAESKMAVQKVPTVFLKLASSADVDRAISVQARQSLQETQWLLHCADQTDVICGVVGWALCSQRTCLPHSTSLRPIPSWSAYGRLCRPSREASSTRAALTVASPSSPAAI